MASLSQSRDSTLREITFTDRHTDDDDDVFFNPIRPAFGGGGCDGGLASWPGHAVTPAGMGRRWQRAHSITSDEGSSQDGLVHGIKPVRVTSIVDGLLHEIYDSWHGPARDSLDSDTTFTECSVLSEAFGRSDLTLELTLGRPRTRVHRSLLESKTISELKNMISDLQHSIGQISTRLVRELKRKDQRLAKLQKHCDFVTAIIQAASLKRRIDMRMRFSIQPFSGDDAFHQWHDAMKAVARLPLGIPSEFRKKVWLAMADSHLEKIKVDWDKTLKFAFNDRSNPDDNTLGMQIIKDLHRTGWSGFSGQENDEDRAILKRVLLAYARWNKSVGYCQGFNVLAALILEVVERKEGDALKVMILLIDHILPESYFANNLRALSVDMAVFRDLLRYKLPQLSKHLDYLQAAARDETTGASYEPPLTNVFTMQWFLTLFATCLPKETALRVCDSVFLEGSEILLRTAVAIWGKLQDRILSVQSADEFYTIMGVLAQEMLDGDIIDADDLIKTIYAMAPFPFPQLSELREKYTYNITPFTAAMATGRKPRTGSGLLSDDDDLDDEDIENISCFTGIFPPQSSPTKIKNIDSELSASALDISKVGPGAYGPLQTPARTSSAYQERMNTDITSLKSQYKRLRERQKQAHIILAAASAKHQQHRSHHQVAPAVVIPPIETPVAVNHLFVGKKGMGSKNRKIADAPRIAPLAFLPVIQAKVTSEQASTNTSNPAKQRTASEMFVSAEASHSSQEAEIRDNNNSKPLTSVNGENSIEAENVPNMDETVTVNEEMLKNNNDSDSCHHQDVTTDNTNNIHIENKEESPSCQPTVDILIEDVDGKHTVDGSTAVNRVSSDSELDALDKEVSDTLNRSDNDNSKSLLQRPGVLKLSVAARDAQSDNNKEGNAEYITKLTYQTHKSNQEGSRAPNPGNVVCQSVSLSPVAPNSHSRSPSPHSPTSPGNPKPFYPFAGRHINHQKVKNGIKLGLYSPDLVPSTENSGMKKSASLTSISRAHINACLHRQYMAEIKQQSKTAKR